MQSESVSAAGFPHTRRCFHVKGHPEADQTSERSAADCTLYVEHLVPFTSRPGRGETAKPPLVLIPGAAHTGACWVTKPDGEPGWSSFFLARGHEVYLVDPPRTGRGGGPWSSDAPGAPTPQFVAHRWTAVARHAPWPQARLHTQWPGASATPTTAIGQPGDPVFDAYVASLAPLLRGADEAGAQLAMRAAGAALLDRIGRRVVLVAHSLGAPRALVVADARPALVAGLVALEPNGPPWSVQAVGGGGGGGGGGSGGGVALERAWGLTEAEMSWTPAPAPGGRPRVCCDDDEGRVKVGGRDGENDDPGNNDGGGGGRDDDGRGDGREMLGRTRFILRTEKSTDPAVSDCTLQVEDETNGIVPRRLINLVDVPVAVVTGEASHHAMYDWCTVKVLKQAGVRKVDHIELWKRGIRGNGHLFILEKNSDEIAEVTRAWIQSLEAH
ncbi:uncharacterized protein LTHEOB_11244 [Neofusicoccum parvum]|uniref:Uncharacterized protein LTHEOB_11244 n=1 Tax=Neofusicoccum parvum TaxID=310453 RepID=A0ACB5RPX3_9PEZI|nr:uncharacterized protein LTHEOB_11244 [Neofusicoccum parvum]